MTKKQKALHDSEVFVRALSKKLNGDLHEKVVKKVAKKVAKALPDRVAA